MLAAQTPLAEVLTVVRQHPVAVLAYPGASSLDHLLTLEVGRDMRFDPYRAAAGESSQRNFFDGSPAQPICKSRVMHDLAIAHIDSVVQISSTGCNEVRTQRWLLKLWDQLFQASHC
jgi:hypothetical protein